MLEGTRRLFPNDYEKFKTAMIQAADEDQLPVTLQLNDIKDYTLKDFQDVFTDFNLETGLELTGRFSLNHGSGRLTVTLEIDRMKPDEGETMLIQ